MWNYFILLSSALFCFLVCMWNTIWLIYSALFCFLVCVWNTIWQYKFWRIEFRFFSLYFYQDCKQVTKPTCFLAWERSISQSWMGFPEDNFSSCLCVNLLWMVNSRITGVACNKKKRKKLEDLVHGVQHLPSTNQPTGACQDAQLSLHLAAG